ncbi:hypothetical protein ACFOD4_10970 [Pseudoroseomonas globiformis]|uniref:Uncharacterized protein n=1 Tax=Teichococcus globiformis TaxID=2307229 RepID=A0ABV7G271_9PROT
MSDLWNGLPDEPHRSDWHWIEDGDGLRPLLWRGDDWPEPADRRSWRDGFAMLEPADLRNGRYHGRVMMPPVVAARFRLDVMFATA